MKKIAAIIFENNEDEILLYLRDNKPTIPFPNHWDLFGGYVEEGETPEQALVREVKEELFNALGERKRFKKWLVASLWKNIQNQTRYQDFTMKRWVEFVQITRRQINSVDEYE